VKRTSILFLLVASSLGLQAQTSPTPTPAGPAGKTWLQLQGAGIHQSRSEAIQSGFGYGGGLGLWATDRLGLEVSTLTTNIKARQGDVSRRETQANLSGLLNFNPDAEHWVPFLRLGVGGTSLAQPTTGERFDGVSGRTWRLNLHGGLGVQAHFNPHWMASLEARVTSIRTTFVRTETAALLGVGYVWGGKVAPKPVAAPEPKIEPKPEVKPEPKPEPPAPVVVAPPPPPVVAPPPPVKIVLDEATLHFENGKAELNAAGIEALHKVAEGLKAYKGSYNLVVTGYTSSVGSPSYNKVLSKRRAQVVAETLQQSGIPSDIITVQGAGPADPLAPNTTIEGQARNRRTEIDVKLEDAKVELRKLEIE